MVKADLLYVLPQVLLLNIPIHIGLEIRLKKTTETDRETLHSVVKTIKIPYSQVMLKTGWRYLNTAASSGAREDETNDEINVFAEN